MVRCRERGRSSPLRASRERRVFPNRHLKVGTPETGYWRPGVLAALTLTKPNRTARPSAPPVHVYMNVAVKGLMPLPRSEKRENDEKRKKCK